jgi:hypothetical protein
MNVAAGGHLRLHFQKDPIVGFFPILQKGFYIRVKTSSLMDILCQSSGLDADQVGRRIQTLFLNGKPVDDIASTDVHDGDCLALSAAMPGLVGATMRSGGVLAGFRHSISHRTTGRQSAKSGGVLLIKLFNLLIKEMGPRFLQQGILIRADELQNLLNSQNQIHWEDCSEAELDFRRIEIDTLAAMDWDPDKGLVHLEVTSGCRE